MSLKRRSLNNSDDNVEDKFHEDDADGCDIYDWCKWDSTMPMRNDDLIDEHDDYDDEKPTDDDDDVNN